MFGENCPSVCRDIEDAVAAFDELRLVLDRVRDLRRQPGSFGQVLSPPTVGNGNLHDGLNPTASMTRFSSWCKFPLIL